MEQLIQDKILSWDDLDVRLDSHRREGKIIVQSHGVFDLIHPGIIKHLSSAKTQGDILVVSIIKDKDVRRGPGRPVFPEEFRMENVASLAQVDYVCLVDDDVPFDCVKRINPDVLARGQEWKERDYKIHDTVFNEENKHTLGKSRVFETAGFPLSSSQIVNNFLDIYPKETKDFLKEFSNKYSFHDIVDRLNQLKDLKVLLIGDGIIDEYNYCESMGKSAKAHLVVSRYLSHEIFAGGAFAIANHVSGLCDKVELVTLLGKEDSKEDFILSNLNPKISTKFFYREDGPTIVKKRYINQYLNQKLFEINFLNDSHINGNSEADVVDYLKTAIPEYDLVLVSDFGHGFITDKIIKVIEEYSPKYAVNTQTNSANAGYNMVTKYSNPSYVCLDEPELRLTAQRKYTEIENVARNISRTLNTDFLVVTMGKRGSLGVNGKTGANRTPVFSSKVVDTVGAGDAFFAFTAPCFAQGMPMDMVSFIGNSVGALAVQVVCNKKPVQKHELLEFINALLK
ncbi:MAG: PfkB family carbohydrate kinase [bacterium]